jgi:hypothetical protein
MCCLERIFECICLNTNVIVSFVGLQFVDNLTFPVLAMGFRRILLKRHFGVNNANIDKCPFFRKEVKSLLFLCVCILLLFRIQLSDQSHYV